MALAALIAAYSIAGGIGLFMYGDFLWFLYPEVPIYGGISMAIGACSILLLLAFANRSRRGFFSSSAPCCARLTLLRLRSLDLSPLRRPARCPCSFDRSCWVRFSLAVERKKAD